VVDPFSSNNPAFSQLIELANQLGESMLHLYQWQILEKEHQFVTAFGDTGEYPLPDDFAYMIDQTAWQKGVPGAAYPLLGPASAQIWSYLTASQNLNITIYAWFRQNEGVLQLWPQPPPVDIPIQYRYVSRNWVIDGESPPSPPTYKQEVSTFADIVRYDPILFIRGLKLAFLGAKGFDTTAAQEEFRIIWDSISGHDVPSPVLNLAGGGIALWRPLDSLVNVPQTGYGS
jgi:hypothetical protein